MGMFKFNAQKVKEHLEEVKRKLDEAKNSKSKKYERNIHEDLILKVEKSGDYLFRAFPYIHNEDYLFDPFPDRFYHFGIPGVGTVFCPQKNTGGREKCAICDFVWEQMKAEKGNKEEVRRWSEKLPKRRLFVPGILRDRENEGVKFLSLSTGDNEPGKHHQKLINWLQKDSTADFLDPVNGLDLILSYEDYDDNKSAALNGAKFGFKEIDLERDRTPISKDPEGFWQQVESSLKNIDKDIPGYELKSYEDTLDVLEKWQKALAKKAGAKKPVDEKKDNEGISVVKTSDKLVSDEDKPAQKDEAPKTETKTASTSEDRKARAKELLKKTTPTS